MNMPKSFLVRATVSKTITVYISAETEDEARERFEELDWEDADDEELLDWTLTSIEENK